jgi:hypothetical protein
VVRQAALRPPPPRVLTPPRRCAHHIFDLGATPLPPSSPALPPSSRLLSAETSSTRIENMPRRLRGSPVEHRIDRRRAASGRDEHHSAPRGTAARRGRDVEEDTQRIRVEPARARLQGATRLGSGAAPGRGRPKSRSARIDGKRAGHVSATSRPGNLRAQLNKATLIERSKLDARQLRGSALSLCD